jgi:hypothetical protein
LCHFSYQQIAVLKSDEDGWFDLNPLTSNAFTYEEFSDAVAAMSRLSALSDNDMAYISACYQHSGIVNSTSNKPVTYNDLRRALNRAGVSTAQVDTDHDGKIERNEMMAALARLAPSADRNRDGRVTEGERNFARMSVAEQNRFLAEVRERVAECVTGRIAIAGADADGNRSVTAAEAANALINRGIISADRIDSSAEFQAILCSRPVQSTSRN